MSAFAALVYPGLAALFTYLVLAVWAERKIAAKVQWRYGPLYVSERAGGILQSVADMLKLIFSELVLPGYSNKALFAALPALVFFLEALPLVFIPGSGLTSTTRSPWTTTKSLIWPEPGC
ncbi:MAG: NADH-quinone oxidoreductase subunit H [Thermoproteus sp.]|nr:NADH-quinone oxidoreductase subunit H [Thermoproteus sp.]